MQIRNNIYTKIELLEKSNMIHEQDMGAAIRHLADSIKCFNCLDTGKSWQDRKGLPFAAWDGRGKYDIMKCIHCSSGKFSSCSHYNELRENGIWVFHSKNEKWEDRFNELKQKVERDDIINMVKKNQEKEQDKEYEKKREKEKDEHNKELLEPPLYEVCKSIHQTHTETTLDIHIGVNEIVGLIKNTVEAYFGDIFSIVELSKELNISFNISDSESIRHDKITKIIGNNYLGIKTTTKLTQQKLKTGFFDKGRYAREYNADIFIIKNPLNHLGREKAKFILSKIANDMTDDILTYF